MYEILMLISGSSKWFVTNFMMTFDLLMMQIGPISKNAGALDAHANSFSAVVIYRGYE